jgi:hypothetical protein
MPFAIVLAPEAVEDLNNLKANVRAAVRAALETLFKASADQDESQPDQAAAWA